MKDKYWVKPFTNSDGEEIKAGIQISRAAHALINFEIAKKKEVEDWLTLQSMIDMTKIYLGGDRSCYFWLIHSASMDLTEVPPDLAEVFEDCKSDGMDYFIVETTNSGSDDHLVK